MKKPAILLVLTLAVAFASGFAIGRGPGIKAAKPLVTIALSQEAPLIADPVEKPAPRFDWARLESTNYADFVGNLRAVRCPERTITDIVEADLRRMHASQFAEIARASALLDTRVREREKTRRTDELIKRIDDILYNDLKLQRPIRSGNTLFTADQEKLIAQARTEHPWVSVDLTNPEASARAWTNRLARLEFLSPYLTREQILFYQLDREGGASRVERLLAGINPTKDEFLRVADVVLGDSSLAFNGSMSPEVAEALSKILAPERLALLKDLQKEEYQTLRMYAVGLQLAPDVIGKLVSLRKSTYDHNPVGYAQEVRKIFSQPHLAEIYLQNRAIHPDGDQ
jgi:hypothetical protein